MHRISKSFQLSFYTDTVRANLEYNITEDDRIVAHLGNKQALLEETLISHRLAISLNPTNTDILFNGGQVLTSLSELLLELGTQESAKFPARALLEEAVDLFTHCLESQQRGYEHMQAEIAKAQASGEYQEVWQGELGGGVSLAAGQEDQDAETASSSSEAPGDWATIEEPLTPEAILETCIAQLGALTTLLGLYDPSELSHIEKKASDGTDTAAAKIPALITLIENAPSPTRPEEPKAGPTLSIGGTSSTGMEIYTTPIEDALLATANFRTSVAEVSYRSGQSDSTTYAQTIEQLFTKLTSTSPPESSTFSDLAKANISSSYADALIDLASTLADGPRYTPSSPTFSTDVEIQWTALTQAQNLLTTLSSPPYKTLLPASQLADIFIARGDTDLFRFRISLFENAKPAWIKSKMVLVENAGVFYRGGRTYAEKAGVGSVRETANAKAVIAEVLKEVASGSSGNKENSKGMGSPVVQVLEQMVEEGIVGNENAEGVLQIIQ